jgi:hypothetical protein
VYAGSEQEHHRHRIKNGDKRQSKQADWPLEVGGRYTHQLGEISHRADVGLGAPALGVNLHFRDLQAGKRPSLALARRNDVGAITALLVSDRHRTEGAAKPCRCLDGRVDLGNAPIEVGDGLALDGDADIGVGGSIRERQIDGRHMIKVGACEEADTPTAFRLINTPIIATRTRRRTDGAECQYPDMIKGPIRISADALPPVLQMLIAKEFKLSY